MTDKPEQKYSISKEIMARVADRCSFYRILNGDYMAVETPFTVARQLMSGSYRLTDASFCLLRKKLGVDVRFCNASRAWFTVQGMTLHRHVDEPSAIHAAVEYKVQKEATQ